MERYLHKSKYYKKKKYPKASYITLDGEIEKENDKKFYLYALEVICKNKEQQAKRFNDAWKEIAMFVNEPYYDQGYKGFNSEKYVDDPIMKSIYWLKYFADINRISNCLIREPVFYIDDKMPFDGYYIDMIILYDVLNANQCERIYAQNEGENVGRSDLKKYRTYDKSKQDKTFDKALERYNRSDVHFLGELYFDGNSKAIKKNVVDVAQIYFADTFQEYRPLFKQTKDLTKFDYEYLKGFYKNCKEEYVIVKPYLRYKLNEILGVEESLIFDEIILPQLKGNINNLSESTIEKLVDSVNKLDYISARLLMYRMILTLSKNISGLSVANDVISELWCDAIDYYSSSINSIYEKIYDESFKYVLQDDISVYDRIRTIFKSDFVGNNVAKYETSLETHGEFYEENKTIIRECNQRICQRNLNRLFYNDKNKGEA